MGPILFSSKCSMHKNWAEETSEQKMYFLTLKLALKYFAGYNWAVTFIFERKS